MAVFNFGSINIDHIYSVPHFVVPGETLSSSNYQSVLGGKGANQSIACALAGEKTIHVGAVHLSDKAFIASMEDFGVDCSHVSQQSDTASGHAIIQVNQHGENAIVLFGGANQILNQSIIEKALDAASTDDWVLLQNETNAIEDIINLANQKGLQIAFNPAPMTPNVKNLPLDKLDLLFVNEIEAMQLTDSQDIEQASKALQHHYPNTKVILTMGKAGVRYLHKGERLEVSGFTVNAVDTTAAGDTFTGYFLANYIKGLKKGQDNPESALQAACAAAALCVTKQGAAPSIPNAQAVLTMLAEHGK